MAKKCEDKVIITTQEYNRAIDGILGDMNPENCASTVEIYAMFSKIAQFITDSQRYDEMNVVDSAKIDDSIECIKTMLKSMIGDETFNYAVMSHLGMLDDDAISDDEDAASDDEDDEDSDDDDAEASDHVESDDSISSRMAVNRQNLDEISKGSPLANIVKAMHEDAAASDKSKNESNDCGGIEDDESKSDDESSKDAAEKDNDLIDYESIDMFKVWYTCHTADFNDFDGYVLLAAIGRRHGFNSGYVTEQLLYIMHNYNIGCNKIHYIGAAITANGVQKAFEKDPKAGDLVYFAYCEKPTFVMYSNMSVGNCRYIIYQLDKETSAIIEIKICDKPDLKSVCDVLNVIDVDKTAFSNGFDDLKSLCHNHGINFNVLYRKILECYTQGANIEIDHISNIKFDIIRKFDTRDECIRYAENTGSDGDLFLIANRPTREYPSRNNGWVMIFGLIAGCYADKTKKLLKVDAVKVADYSEALVSNNRTIDLNGEPGDDIDVSSMKYATNEDISKNIKNGYDEMMRHMNDSQ